MPVPLHHATCFKGSKSGQVIKETIPQLRQLGDNDVSIQITHSGVCGTDLHYLKTDMVLGHEGVGVVVEVGAKVKNFKAGDRVGFGYVHGGCGHCEYCLAGRHFYCAETQQYGINDFDQGSWATHAVWPETLLHKIPDQISSVDAGPFMCAGLTVFVPFLRNQIQPGARVAIVGIGGLGHLAIQFAAKVGAEVIVFSSSESKRAEAESLGATEFWVMDELKKGKKDEVKKIDHLIDTAAKFPDWDLLLDLMAPFGHIHLLTLTPERLSVPFLPVLLKELSLHGSCSSTPAEFEKMLHFVAVHGIKPMKEVFPMTEDGVQEVVKRLQAGEIRYRGILEVR